MPFKKGNKIRGSRKGIPNRVSKEFKENVENLFQDMGGYQRALDWFNRHPEAFYLKVWVKLAPLQVIGQVTHHVDVEGAREQLEHLINRQVAALRARDTRDRLKLVGPPSGDSPTRLDPARKTGTASS